MTNMSVHRMTVDEFLAWEDRQEPKYELVDGRPVMMTGGTRVHGQIQSNLVAQFRQQLRGRNCSSFSDFKVICGNGNVRYPDVLVDCGKGLPKDLAAAAPTVVVEIVSPSSQATDSIRKVRDYASIPTITTYLIVGQDVMDVSVLRRRDHDLVLVASLSDPQAIIEMPEVGVTLAVADVYEDIDFPVNPAPR